MRWLLAALLALAAPTLAAVPEDVAPLAALEARDTVEIIGPGGGTPFPVIVATVVAEAAAMERIGYRVRLPEGGEAVAPTAFVRLWREARARRVGEITGPEVGEPAPPPLPAPPAPVARDLPALVRNPMVVMRRSELIATHELVQPGEEAADAAYHVALVARRGAADKIDAAGRVICELGEPSSVAEPTRRAVMVVPVARGREGPLSAAYDFERVAAWYPRLAVLGLSPGHSRLFGFLALENADTPMGLLDAGSESAFSAADPLFIDLSGLSVDYVETVTGEVIRGMAEGRADSHLDMLGLMRAISVVQVLGETLVAVAGLTAPAAEAASPLPPC